MKIIKFKNIFGREIRSRNAIDTIVSKMKNSQDDYIFDMDGITFISRSFADELYNLKMNYGNVMFVNRSKSVCQMMNVVWKGRQKSKAMLRLKMLSILLVTLCLMGCRTLRYVPVPEYHTLYKTRVDTVQRWDSVYYRDSVYIAAKGDTIYLTKTHWRERFRNVYNVKVDTVMQRDSIRVPYPVAKPLTKWQRWKMDLGGWAMGVAVLLVILVILKVTKTVI